MQTKNVKKIEKNVHDESQEKICILQIVTDKKDEENIVPNFKYPEARMKLEN